MFSFVYLEVFLARIFDRLKKYNYEYEVFKTNHEIDGITFQTYELLDHFSGDDLLNRMVKESKDVGVIYDIGSNVGSYSIGLARGLPYAEIHAFEPNPEMTSRHRRNISIDNRIKNNIHTIGISNEVEERTFYIANPPNRSSFSRAYIESVRAVVRQDITVPTTTIDKVVDQEIAPPPDVIKMDIEGHTEAVIEGAENTLATYGPTIYLEPHHTYERTEDGEIQEIDRESRLRPILQNVGYEVQKSGYEWICKPTLA